MTTDYIGRDRRRSTFQVELARLQPRGIAACGGQGDFSASAGAAMLERREATVTLTRAAARHAVRPQRETQTCNIKRSCAFAPATDAELPTPGPILEVWNECMPEHARPNAPTNAAIGYSLLVQKAPAALFLT